MTPVSLPVLLCVIPLTWLSAALLPLRRKPLAMALGGLAMTAAAGGMPAVLLTALSVCLGWLTVRLLPDRRRHSRRTALIGTVGAALQLLMLLPGALLLTGAARLPLLLCVMQSLDCIRLRALGAMPIPALSAFWYYQCALPRLFCGPVQTYSAADRQYRSCVPSVQLAGRGALRCTRGLMQCVLLSAPMCTLWRELTAQRAAVSAADTWLLLTVFYCAVYYAVRGLAELGTGLAALMGYALPAPFHEPILARSLADLTDRWLTWLAQWCRRVLLRDGLPLDNAAYFVRMMLFFCLLGSYLRPGLQVLLWSAFAAALLTLSRVLRRRGFLLPRTAAMIAVGVCVLLCAGLMQADSVTGSIGMLRALVGANGLLFTGGTLYLVKIHWVPLLLSLIGLLPLGRLLRSAMQKSRALQVTGSVLIPLCELAVLLICMTELLRQWTSQV